MTLGQATELKSCTSDACLVKKVLLYYIKKSIITLFKKSINTLSKEKSIITLLLHACMVMIIIKNMINYILIHTIVYLSY